MDENLINFWKNYENIINWGYRMSGAQGPDGSGSTAPIINIQTRESNISTQLTGEEYEDNDDSSSDSVDIDLEYLNFSKKTLEHQEKIEKEKKKVDKEYGLCSSSNSDNELESPLMKYEKKINPKEIYGSKADEIVYLENKLQSNFSSFCSAKKPTLWPGMAFNLSVPDR